MKKLLLIDGHSLLHRAFHALPEFTSSDGTPVGAVYGFARMLLSALKQRTPDSVILAWDTAKPTFRHQMYVEYKQHRPETDDSLRQQILLSQQLVETFGIEQFFFEGYEADDVIATTIKKFKSLHKDDCEIEVLSSDMDMLQLVRENVFVLAVKTGMSELVRFDIPAVVEKYGLTPGQLPDLKGLMGDNSDNIPGVKGVGIKSATSLLLKYNSVEGVYEHISEVQGKTKELLSSQYEMAVLSKELATIRDDAPIALAQNEDYQYEIDFLKVQSLFQKYGFKSLMPLLTDLKPIQTTSSIEYDVAIENANSDDFFNNVSRQNVCFVHFPNESEDIFISDVSEKVWFVSIDLLEGNPEFISKFSKLMESVIVVSYDVKALKHKLNRYEISIPKYFDLAVADVMLQTGRGPSSVQESLFKHLEVSVDSSNDPSSRVTNSAITSYLPKLYRSINEQVNSQSEPIRKILAEIEMPLVDILFRMELRGVLLDKKKLAQIHEKQLSTQLTLQQEIYEAIGHEVNINSPKQLESVLFDELKLPVVKRTKTQRSTNEAVLKQLAHAHPVIQKILDFRGVAKLTSTYTEKLADITDQYSRMHTTYNQVKVVTSRLSSENPNLQNIPRDKSIGIRSAFVSPEGCSLVALDYSQIELRILAHLSGDEHLKNSFIAGQDIHTATAAKLFDTFVDEVEDRQRQIAKIVNFAVMYGMGPHALSENLDIEFIEAKKYIDDFFEFYPQVKEWRDNTISFAKQNGYVQTLWGRTIEIPEIISQNKRLISAGERMATNYPNQGTQADLIKSAMVQTDTYLKKNSLHDVHMIMQVHDELVFEVPEDQVKETVGSIQEIMQEVVTLSVPIVVESKVGKNWQEMEKIKVE